MVPSELMEKSCKEPLVQPSCCVELVLLAPETWGMRPVPEELAKFQLKARVLAPTRLQSRYSSVVTIAPLKTGYSRPALLAT